MTKDGWRWIAWMSSAVLNDDGEPTEIIAVGRDVTVRRGFENALHESEARLLSIMNNAPGAIILKDREGRLVAANRAHLERLGLKWEDLEGKTAYDYNTPEIAKEIVEQERQVMETRRPQTFEVTREFPGLGKRALMVVRFPVVSEDSQLIGVGALSIDVTDFNSTESGAEPVRAIGAAHMA
jgi:PAS domain S-box-containing protein